MVAATVCCGDIAFCQSDHVLFHSPAAPPSRITPVRLAEDSNGILWLAARNGVFRFDGIRYSQLGVSEEFDAPSASDIAASPDGSLFLATGRGLAVYRDGRVNWITRDPTAAVVVLDRDTVALSANGLRIGHRKNSGQWTFVRIPNMFPIRRLTVGADGRLWFGNGRNIVALRLAGQSWEIELFGVDRGVPAQEWDQVYRDRYGRLWLSRVGEVIALSTQGLTLWRYVSKPAVPDTESSVLAGPDGRIWIRLGISLLVAGAGLPVSAEARFREGTHFTSHIVTRAGQVWLGMSKSGLTLWDPVLGWPSWTSAYGFRGRVTSFFRNRRGVMHISTETGVYRLLGNRWERVLTRPAMSMIYSFLEEPDGSVWMTSADLGLIRVSESFELLDKIPMAPGVDPTLLRSLLRDRQGRIFVAGRHGVHAFDPRRRTLRLDRPPGDSTNVADIAEDIEGRLWASHWHGVAVYDRSAWRVWDHRHGLLIDPVRSIAPAPGGEAWIGYRDNVGFSVLRLNGGTPAVNHFRPEDGYGNGDSVFLRRDGLGRFWRGTSEGIFVYRNPPRYPGDWTLLDHASGLAGDGAAQFGFWEDKDHSVWIATDRGVDHFPANLNLTRRDTGSPILLSAVRQQDRVQFGPKTQFEISAGTPVEIDVTQGIEVPLHQQEFFYRVRGVASEWRYAVGRIIRLAGFAPGTYTLEVTVDPESRSIYSFRLSAAPAFTWVFPVLIAGGAIGGLAIFVRRRRRRAYWDEKRAFLETIRGQDPLLAEAHLKQQYKVGPLLARGALSSVYRGTDTVNRRPVVVKVFESAPEIEILTRLNDPGVVRLFDSGEISDGRRFLILEFVDGPSLRQLLKQGPIPLDRALGLIEQIGAALAYVHSMGIAHCDLKPENILVRDAGDPGEQIVLIDFGIARSLPAGRSTAIQTAIVGSFSYMAPEQLIGRAEPASDIYALALVAFEMLTGHRLPELTMSWSAEMTEPIARWLAEKAPGVPLGVAASVAAALRYDPRERPQDPASWARTLREQEVGKH